MDNDPDIWLVWEIMHDGSAYLHEMYLNKDKACDHGNWLIASGVHPRNVSIQCWGFGDFDMDYDWNK